MRVVRNVTLYHITKKENLPGIKKEGLRTKYMKVRKENELLGLPNSGLIYTVLDKHKLVKPVKSDKYVMISITLPKNIYDNMEKIEGDPVWHWANKLGEKKAKEKIAEAFRKVNPEKFGNMTTDEIFRDATPFEYMSPDNCIVFKEDIDPKYISVVSSSLN